MLLELVFRRSPIVLPGLLALFLGGSADAAVKHEVRPGDNLWSLSRRYGVSESALKSANGLQSDRIRIGQHLTVPTKERGQEQAGPVLNSSEGPRTGREPAATTLVHRVRRGETLSHIARRYSVSVAALRELNGLSGDRLQIGQLLVTPSPGRSERDGTKSPREPRLSGVVEYSWHTVRRGENLTTIARAHGVTIGALKRGNHLSSDRLRAGQRLRVPGQLPGAQASAAAIITEEEVAVLSDSIRSVIRGFSPGVRSPFTQGGAGSVRADGNPLLAKLVDIAKSLLGIRYRRGGASTSGFDCSGFVQYVYDCFSLPLPHSAAQQFGLGDPIGLSELSIGDLLFFKTRRRPFPSHVGIYIGDNQFIHASSGKRRVTITSLDDPYYSKRFVGARRVAGDPLPGNETSELVPGEEPTTSQFLRLRSPHRRPAADPSPSRG